MNWTLAKAKDHRSEVIGHAQGFGPKRITVRGERKAVVLSDDDDEALCDGAPRTLKELLLRMNLEGMDLERDQTPARDIEL